MPLVAQVEDFFRRHRDTIVAAYVFGSVARGDERPGSDVDVAVLLAEAPPATLEGLRGDLAEALERLVGRDVDLVILNQAPADLVHRVLRDGCLVLETDRAARVRFEVQRRREYFDLLPILEEYRRPRKAAEA